MGRRKQAEERGVPRVGVASPPPVAPCPLCGATAEHLLGAERNYYRCPCCRLIHVPQCEHLSPAEEKTVYDWHDNRVDDPRYRRFLSRLAQPLLTRVAPPARVLEFGCGPGPALAAMLEEAGLEVRLFDPFYYPDASSLEFGYDAITATEVLEHLARPGAELARLWQLLRPGGWLGVMTQRQPESDRFADWHYRRDPTHVAFYHAATFCWLARRCGAALLLFGNDVALLKKGLAPSAPRGGEPIARAVDSAPPLVVPLNLWKPPVAMSCPPDDDR